MQEAGLPYVSFIDRPNTDKALGGGGVIVRLLMDGVSRPYVLICAHEISPGDEVNSVQKGVFFYHSSDQQPEPGFALNVLRVRGQLVLDRTADLAVLAMGQNVIDLVDSKPGSIAPIYSGTVQVGDEVITVGAPHGLRSTLLKGEVTYTDRSVNGGPTIQTSLLATGGNSGGPVFEVVQDGAGNVGIALTGLVASVSADTPGVTFAIPLQTMIDFLARFGLSFDPNVHVQEARRMPHQATPDSPVLPPLDPRFPVAPAVRWDWSQP